MKKAFLTIISMLAMVTCAMAQETIVINGQVIPVSKIKSITYGIPTTMLPEVMKKDEKIKLFTEALYATKLNEKLYDYSDSNYSVGTDSTTWLNDVLCIHVAAEYDNVAYPAKRYYQFTAFAETDEVLKEKYGITTLDALRKKAHELYDPMYPEDKSVTDETDSRNALNRFVAYHILDRYAPYYKLTAIDGGKLSYNFNRRKQDVSDRYETLMPHSLIKFSFPSGTLEGLCINRRGVQSRGDYRGVFVRGAKIDQESETTALNGLYYHIDDIIAYDQETQQVVHDERMRFDATTLSPDFMTLIHDGSMARGHKTRYSANNYMYGAGGQSYSAAKNQDLSVGFKANSIRNFEFENEWTHIHVRPRCLNYWSYQGDEVTIKGNYDVRVKLPSLPAGTYELRFGTCIGFESRGINQFYLNEEPMGIPVDMRPDGYKMFGKWVTDAQGEEAVAEFDKYIRNLGWMKGPADYAPGEKYSFSGSTFRDLSNCLRCIIGTFTTDGKSDNYLRIKQIMESGGELDFDYIEIVPKSVYDNPDFPEDIY